MSSKNCTVPTMVLMNKRRTKRMQISVIVVCLKAEVTGNLMQSAIIMYYNSRKILNEFGAFCQ